MKNTFKVKNLTFDFVTMSAFIGNKLVPLSKIETKLLLFFIMNKDRVLSHKEIYAKVWGWYNENNPAVLNTTISRLRSKIGKDKIYTIRGKGYILRTK